ncbi:hypothetical protein BDV40DRAFT_282697 [Aspergillus tamarii]|uniref:Uncharacterized protein n=1 Tax=Aspergillus tamarii TaxID=41984 RepID=A0A5N6UBA4_ASPTM|nr:hypothetical protein BDV40DRAFT_282697 [Aspergillus tamarii]
MQGSLVFHLQVVVTLRCLRDVYLLFAIGNWSHKTHPLFENGDAVAPKLFFYNILSCIGLTSGGSLMTLLAEGVQVIHP